MFRFDLDAFHSRLIPTPIRAGCAGRSVCLPAHLHILWKALDRRLRRPSNTSRLSADWYKSLNEAFQIGDIKRFPTRWKLVGFADGTDEATLGSNYLSKNA